MEVNEKKVTLVKMTKEERVREKEAIEKAKREANEKIPEKDKERKKHYQSTIMKTLVIFIVSLIVFVLLVLKMIPTTIGLICLILLAAWSTFITRSGQ